MSLRLDFRSAAANDLEEAAGWYESKQSGLGRRFLEEINLSLERVQESPLSFAIAEDEIRRSVVSRFPYCIYFIVETDRVVVIAIVHARRHAHRWKSRL